LSAAQAGTSGYTVRKGDTLDKIARHVHVPVSVLAEVNGIKNVDLIRDGQVLRLSGDKVVTVKPQLVSALVMTGARTHVVAKGENLTAIARNAGTTVAELTRRNHLANPNKVRVGTRLDLPGGAWACPVRGKYTVVSNWNAPRPGHRHHQGNDIFAKRGTTVLAPVGGTLRAAPGKIAGNALYLAGADGNTYYFAHLDRYVRSSGAVDAGTVIGAVGNSGNAELLPPHLHFEIHPGNGSAVDPFPTLRHWC
jgi:murein DD-endopeptidase MepM/ murein hydrolase activator NlpD